MNRYLYPLLATALMAGAETATAAAPAAAAPEPKPEREKRNGVTRPSPGTATGNVWAIADEISAANGRPAKRSEVTAKGATAGINASTVTTQYGQWRRFWGITKEATAEVVNAPADAAAAPAKKAAKKKGKAAAAPETTSAQLEESNARSAEAIAAGGVEG